MKTMTFKAWRKKKKLTIDDIHDITGISTSTLWSWDADASKLPRKALIAQLKFKYEDAPFGKVEGE